MLVHLATSFSEPGKFSLYNIVLFVHIAAAIVAFGITFTYPLIYASLSRPANRRHLAWFHEVEEQLGKKIITGGATVILLAGLYLASEGPYDFGSTFVSIGLVVIIVLLGLGGAFFAPTERKATALAARDIAAAGDGEVELSDEYQAVAKRLVVVGGFSSLLVLIAVFLMVVKPGA